ncbi:MAG: hypothetical protein WCA91_12270 [Candidatus Acidiferrales bacterium]
MINGVHALFYAEDADNVRGFFKDVLKLDSVDAGHGWLIFALPPAELAIHPTGDLPHHELYLMCDDIHKTMNELKAKNVQFARPVKEEQWARRLQSKFQAEAKWDFTSPNIRSR